jgi:hypothetical protein
MLAYESAFKTIKETDLKIKIERLRHDHHLVTSDMLKDVDFADNKHIKQLYNYSLARMREKNEMRDDVLSEYNYWVSHIDPFKEIVMR